MQELLLLRAVNMLVAGLLCSAVCAMLVSMGIPNIQTIAQITGSSPISADSAFDVLAPLPEPDTSGSSTARAASLTQTANIQLLTGDLRGAIGALQQAVAIDPDYASAHYALACAYARAGFIDAALLSAEAAIALDEHYRLLVRGGSDFAGIRQSPEFFTRIR